MIFVDTNYFLRFLLKDNSDQHAKALRLFEEGAIDKVKLFTSVIVFFELYWVFTSFYKKEKAEVVEILTQVLQMKFVHFEKETILKQALDFFAEHSLDLEDAYNVVYAKSQSAINFETFDLKLVKIFKKLK